MPFRTPFKERQAALNALFVPGQDWLHVPSDRQYRVRHVDVHGYAVLDPIHHDHLHTNVPYFLYPWEQGPDDWQPVTDVKGNRP